MLSGRFRFFGSAENYPQLGKMLEHSKELEARSKRELKM
jgi:hypothetical protein